MSIPGSDILLDALTVIASQYVTYYKAVNRDLNPVGQDVTFYAPPATIFGSFQPVPRSMYTAYGLDFNKTYYTFYTPMDLMDIQRNVSNDKIVFNGKTFQCEASNDWFAIDGWVGMLCCLSTSSPPGRLIFGFNEVPSINTNQNFEWGNFYA